MLANYRGITINSNVGRLFTRVMTRRMEEDVETRGLLGECQFGFRKGKRAVDTVFILSQLIESRRRKGKKVALAFLDVKKGYDRVWRNGMWATLEKCGYGGKA